MADELSARPGAELAPADDVLAPLTSDEALSAMLKAKGVDLSLIAGHVTRVLEDEDADIRDVKAAWSIIKEMRGEVRARDMMTSRVTQTIIEDADGKRSVSNVLELVSSARNFKRNEALDAGVKDPLKNYSQARNQEARANDNPTQAAGNTRGVGES